MESILNNLEAHPQPQKKESVTPKALLRNIVFKNKDVISLNEDQIIVFVGPNNVGKSLALREIYTLLGHSFRSVIISEVETIKYGDSKSVDTLINSVAKKGAEDEYLRFKGQAIHPDNISRSWEDENRLSILAPLFSKLLTTEERLKIANTAENISILTESPSHPYHFLILNDTFEKEFNKFFKQAFGLDLIVNRAAGKVIPLHVGVSPELESGEDRVSSGYIKKLSMLPTIDRQGDGMRSFVGVLLSAFVAFESLLFIDEPEAFLHPPQAYLLGQMLAANITHGKQIFLATHSEDLLKGLIDKSPNRVKVIRIERNQNTNEINELNSDAIKTLWRDPLLRYSNILSGIFHSKVIICESDGDCRFFGAVMDSLTDDKEQVKPDVLFVHCGGKQRIPVIVNALVRLGVKLLVVADIDVLNSDSPLREIYSGLGGDWEGLEPIWKRLKSEIENKRPELETSDVVSGINKIIEKETNRVFPKTSVEAIRLLLKKVSPWSEVKSAGKSFIPAGEATKLFSEVINRCRSVGFNILEVGELEGFDKTVGGHGPKWVHEVLEKDLKNEPQLEDARRFVSQLISQ